MRVFTAEGALMAEFGERRRIPIAFEQVPPQFINALLDTEDKRFFEHSGIDFISLTNDTLGLVGSLLFKGELGPGASTITMQLARNISLTRERRLLRKFKEMLLALKIERELSKEEILELYLNEMPFGKRAYGVEAAARTYYGKPVEALEVPQLAMLAGVLQAPTAGNPINGPERALARRNLVLSRMRAQGSITDAEYAEFVAAPITAKVHDRALDVPAPFAAEWVRQELLPRFADLYTGGYEVYTTVRGPLQAVAADALRAGLLAYDRRHGYRGPEAHFADQNEALAMLARQETYGGLAPALVTDMDETQAIARLQDGALVVLPMGSLRWRPYVDVDARGPAPQRPQDLLRPGDLIRLQLTDVGWRLAQLPQIQGALVAVHPNTGAVLALEGGFDFGMSQFNNVLQAARQPGSGFKPFVYSAALRHGVTAASIFLDAPLVYGNVAAGTQYRPSNDSGDYNGPTRLREALYKSINLVSMRVLEKVGAGNVLNHVRSFGFDVGNFPRNTQVAIGGGTMAVTPLAMAAGYAVFANGGYRVQPHIVGRVLNNDGDVVFEPRHPIVLADGDGQETPPAGGAEPASLDELLAAPPPPQPAPRAIDARNAFVMAHMLRDVVQRGTGRRARVLERRDLAGKTGTTNEAADTWFNGFSTDVAATVWMGFPNHSPLGDREYGSNNPLPVWIEFMRAALQGQPESRLIQPPGVLSMKIDPATGALADSGQTDAIYEYFLAEYAPGAGAGAADEAVRSEEGRIVTPEELF